MQLKNLSKRTFLILVGIASSLAMSSTALATFSDVPSTYPNYEAINTIQAQNIVNGYPDGTFRPNNLINRSEFIKIIIEAYYPGQASGSNCFQDVGTEWFAKYACFAKTRNIVAGYPDGNFKPANNISFIEIAKILANVKGFTVTPDPNTWYKPYVEKLAEAHAIPASITTFNQKVTRGEMAEMIYRLKNNVTNKPSKTYGELITEPVSFGLPTRLKIPGIDVDSAFEYVGLTSQGKVGVPNDPDNAGWYDLGPRPGDSGSAVIAGHVNWYYGATGVFANLRKVNPGDKIIVQDDKGSAISFVVREVRSYDSTADTTDVFVSDDGKAHLNLITCDGVWNKASGYSKRLVVFTDKA